MAYKRYGGSLNRTGFLLLGFSIFLPLCLLLIGGKLSGKDGNSFQDKRMAKHLADAQKHINSKQTDDALESLRKAKIYGNLPENFLVYEEQYKS